MILQARMGSKRLPGKVLKRLAGEPMLAHIIKRVSTSQYAERMVVATTCLQQDDPIEVLSKKLGVSCFRGADKDSLDRFYQASKSFGADIVVRLTADNPFVDSGFVDWVIEQYLQVESTYDYVDTLNSNTFPLGLSVEVLSFDVLAKLWREDKDIDSREYVTWFIHTHPSQFRVLNLANSRSLSYMRWTVDYQEDLVFARKIYNYFNGRRFSWQEVVEVLEKHPTWLKINQHITHTSPNVK